jgi:hypothetical protein
LNIFISFSEPITWIVGGPDIYVDRGSTLNVTCVVSTRSKPPDYIIWSHFDRVSNLLILTFKFFDTINKTWCSWFNYSHYNIWKFCRQYYTKVLILIKHFHPHTLLMPSTMMIQYHPHYRLTHVGGLYLI